MAVADLIAQTLAQHISNPKVISFAGTKLNEVRGRFIAANRVYNFVLDKKGVSYSPAGRNDSLVFSALFLERLDAARKPKVGNDKCNAGKSYQCGKTCISNRWNCRKGVKDVNDARRIASILASTNEGLKARASGEVSEKAQARGRALFEARNKRLANPNATKQEESIEAKIDRLIKTAPSLTTTQEEYDRWQKDFTFLTPNQRKEYLEKKQQLKKEKEKKEAKAKRQSKKESSKRLEQKNNEQQKFLESIPEGRLLLEAKRMRANHLQNTKYFYGNRLVDDSVVEALNKTSKEIEKVENFANYLFKLRQSAFDPNPHQKNSLLGGSSLEDEISSGKAMSEGVRSSGSIPWVASYKMGDKTIDATIVAAKLRDFNRDNNAIEFSLGDRLAENTSIDSIKSKDPSNIFLNGTSFRIIFPKGQASTLKAKRLIREITEGYPHRLNFAPYSKKGEGFTIEDIQKMLA